MSHDVRFDARHVAAFARLSHDRNPLHCDPDYARTTPFGRTVVHGMGALLRAIGLFAQGRSIQIGDLRARFARPLYLDTEYRLEAVNDGRVATMRYLRGSIAQCEIEFSWSPRVDETTTASDRSFSPLDAAQTSGLVGLGVRFFEPERYAIAPDASSLLSAFDLRAGQLPASQLRTLLWISYFVGMKCPGQQALLVDCAVEFEREPGSDDPSIRDIAVRFDPRFGHATITALGEGIRALRIRALQRPVRVSYDLSAIDAQIGRSRRYAGQVVLVSGSGRGFGAALAGVFALHGATVIVNSRTSADAIRLAKQMTAYGGTSLVAVGDVSSPDDCARIARAIESGPGGLDILVNNASPVIGANGFLEQPVDEFAAFVSNSLRAYVELTRTMLPLLRSPATIVNVSSLYLNAPRPQLTHYLAAKGAIEGLTRGLAAELGTIRLVIARAPRMLTDQTNLPFDREPPASAIGVAVRLIDALGRLEPGPGLTTLDLDAGQVE